MTPRKRKLPKNQRAYKTPSGKKHHLTEIHGENAQYIIDRQGEIGIPHVYTVDNYIGLILVNADEMRKWLAGSGRTSGAEHG